MAKKFHVYCRQLEEHINHVFFYILFVNCLRKLYTLKLVLIVSWKRFIYDFSLSAQLNRYLLVFFSARIMENQLPDNFLSIKIENQIFQDTIFFSYLIIRTKCFFIIVFIKGSYTQFAEIILNTWEYKYQSMLSFKNF